MIQKNKLIQLLAGLKYKLWKVLLDERERIITTGKLPTEEVEAIFARLQLKLSEAIVEVLNENEIDFIDRDKDDS